jgi:nucleotide-binding universal stress UspA family protein
VRYKAGVFLDILVAVDGSPSARRALEQAVDLARAQNSKLTLITVAPPVSGYVTLGRMSSEQIARELEAWASNVLAEALASVPDEVIAHKVRPSGHVGEQIVKELQRGTYDLVVLGTRGRGPAREGLFGSVNGYVHFHSRVAVLSVPYEE